MEQHLRTALWMCFFIWYLSATPIPLTDFNFELLQEVKCPENVTFKFPENMLKHGVKCGAAALATIKEELNKSGISCNAQDRVDQTLHVVKFFLEPLLLNSADCKKEQEKSVDFQVFLEKFKTTVQEIMSKESK